MCQRPRLSKRTFGVSSTLERSLGHHSKSHHMDNLDDNVGTIAIQHQTKASNPPNCEVSMSIVLNRRHVLAALAGAPLAARTASASDAYPSRSVTLVSGYTAGGPVDVFGRIAANHLGEALRVPFVMENRVGASGMIAGEYVAQSTPDGHTLLVTVPSLFTMLPYMLSNIKVRRDDLAPIGVIAEAPMVLICHPNFPATNIQQFIEEVRKNPKLSFASAGTGTLPHLATELLLARVGASALHVPYKGSAQSLQGLVGGQVSFSSDNLAPSLPLIKAGRLRALAVTSLRRFSGLPSIPTLSESGIDNFSATNWFGLFAPSKTPAPIIQRLEEELRRITINENFKEKVQAQGATIAQQGTEQTRARIIAEGNQWEPLIRQLDIKMG